MLNLFNEQSPTIRGNIVLPEFIYVKNGLYANLLKMVSYYRENPRSVDSSHFLVRLLQSITVPLSMMDLRYVDLVSDLADDLSMSLQMTSPGYYGKAFKDGVFYGRGFTEVLISTSEFFDVEDAAANWEDLEPIRVLAHPKTDLNLDLPNGRSTGSEVGHAVLAINIPLLALQYKKFREREHQLELEHQRTVMQFLCMYPLPNLLYSHLDIAIFNRLHTFFKGGETMVSMRRSPLFIHDHSTRLDIYLNKLLRILERRDLYFDAMLTSIPLVSSVSLRDVVRLPRIPLTRQVLWSLIMARIPYISFLLQLNFNSGSNRNRKDLVLIDREIKRLIHDRGLQQGLTRENYKEVMDSLEGEIRAYI